MNQDPRRGRLRRFWKWLGFSEEGEKTGLDLFQAVFQFVTAIGAIMIPIAVVVMTNSFAEKQNTNQGVTEEKRAMNEALQGYFDDMTQLMLAETELIDEARQTIEEGQDPDPIPFLYIKELKQARTLTILNRFNSELLDEKSRAQGKRRVIQFLYQAGLIGYLDRGTGDERPCPAFISLAGADLSGVDMSELNLRGAYLTKVVGLDDDTLTDTNRNKISMPDEKAYESKPLDECEAGPNDLGVLPLGIAPE